MNPKFFGDSFDLVKRFFCLEVRSLGYSVEVDACLTGEWDGAEGDFYRLIGSGLQTAASKKATRSALFLDPDTGVNERGGKEHVSFRRIAEAATRYDLVFSFDQAFSRQETAAVAVARKRAWLSELGLSSLYYNSHARFVFASREPAIITELQRHFASLGIPSHRLVCDGPAAARGGQLASPRVAKSSGLGSSPRATSCLLDGLPTNVVDAIRLRDEARRARGARPHFRCVNCGNAVRPHNEGGLAAAHFEHLERNPDCPLSDPLKT